MNKTILRAIQAAVSAIGAPLGWVLIQVANGANFFEEIQNNWGLYTYMLFGTLAVFISFGIFVGRQEQKITQIAIRDPLTGIYNLRFFIERIEQEISRAKRHSTPISIIYFDLDYFKKVNDKYGHPAGDKVLINVAKKVKELIRTHDIFARVGGEEFAILQPRCGKRDAVENAERIRIAIEDLEIPIGNHQPIKVTLSAGVTQWQPKEKVAVFYKRADENLYQAKKNGRNQVAADQEKQNNSENDKEKTD